MLLSTTTHLIIFHKLFRVFYHRLTLQYCKNKERMIQHGVEEVGKLSLKVSFRKLYPNFSEILSSFDFLLIIKYE